MFYFMTHSTHLQAYSFRLAGRILLYAPSHRQDNISQGWGGGVGRGIVYLCFYFCVYFFKCVSLSVLVYWYIYKLTALCVRTRNVRANVSRERERVMFYLTTHSTHFIYGYMASDIWLRTILIVRKETRCRHIGYSSRLTARVLLYAPSHRQDSTYHGLCYTSRGALAGTRNSSMGQPHEGSIRRPIAS